MGKLTVQSRTVSRMSLPSAVALVIKALKEQERNWKKMKNIKHNGSIFLDDILEIGWVMQPRSMAKEQCGGHGDPRDVRIGWVLG
ncbi:hypothetical protein MLD38_017645 [Melastoma candidum]|uniref:Uncharacterized protein n=1 Tax=Melastoma candidum TaxID=119954 RepID=A0ACB9QR72_9MYRT|nr:hypothetical protein MLD38_017645 [Melastoma candidum]